MAQTMEQRFREQVISDLAELKTSNKNIVEHLLRLNGSVAKHEEAIGKMQIHAATEAEKDRITSRKEKLWWGLIGSAVLVLIEHFGAIVGPWLK